MPPPIYVSGFGENSAQLAARIGDGFMCVGPQADLVKLYRDQGGGDRPVQGGLKGCWAPDTDTARQTTLRLRPSDYVPGETAQLLPLLRHFEQVSQPVTEDMVDAPCGPGPQPFVDTIRAYEQVGFDEVYLQQVGGQLDGAFEFFADQVLPRPPVVTVNCGTALQPCSSAAGALLAPGVPHSRPAGDFSVSR